MEAGRTDGHLCRHLTFFIAAGQWPNAIADTHLRNGHLHHVVHCTSVLWSRYSSQKLGGDDRGITLRAVRLTDWRQQVLRGATAERISDHAHLHLWSISDRTWAIAPFETFSILREEFAVVSGLRASRLALSSAGDG